MVEHLIKENQRKIPGIKIMKVCWLRSNIKIINKSHFSLIIDIINEYMVIMIIYYDLREGYNKYKYI